MRPRAAGYAATVLIAMAKTTTLSPERVVVAGHTKFDQEVPRLSEDEARALRVHPAVLLFPQWDIEKESA